MSRELSEVKMLNIQAARIRMLKEKPYWDRTELCLIFGLSRSRLVNIELAGDGPPWLQIGGTAMIHQGNAYQWFDNLEHTKWAKSKK